MILKKYEKIGSAELGLLATVGCSEVPVFTIPKVAVLSTGDELYEPGADLPFGGIRDCNRTMLLAVLKENNIPSIDLGIVKDEPTKILHALKKGIQEASVILTTGGVSMGDKDFLKEVLVQDLDATIHFGKLNMKPGKPTTFATLGTNLNQKMFFCLPGNPVSAITCFHLFVLPALRKMSGFTNPMPTKIKAKLDFDIVNMDMRPEYRRAILDWTVQKDGVPLAKSTGSQMSSRLLSWRKANGLVFIPSKYTIQKGTLVDVLVVGSV